VSRPAVSLLLADEQALLRTGFRTVLGAEAGLTVVGEAGDGVQAVELTRRLLPDVVVFDLALPRLDGVELTRSVMAAGLPVRMLALTADPESAPSVVQVLREGAAGVLDKDASGAELAAAIRAVAAGQRVLAPSALHRLLHDDAHRESASGPTDEPEAPTEAREDLAGLTDREREVLLLLGRGRSNAEIAAELGVGETTVKTHVGRVLTKLSLRDRVAAVVLVHEQRLLTP
jgi:DNA-binding NarL/FixJ family response regulator